MEQLKWSTPIKTGSENESVLIKSPVIFKTPVKHCDRNVKHTSYKSNKCGFSVLPSHITPPSGLTKFMARNPFETDLTSRLHLSMISPTVFNKVSSPSQHSPDFAWSVDELALMQPAKIDEFPVQQICSIDPETEIKAQAAIDQFFTTNEIIPSPWELKRKDGRTNFIVDSPLKISVDSNSESSKSKKDGWSQTVLTLPSELPPHVMEILKPYFTFTQEQNVDADDANSSNGSLRRKLFFNNEDCLDNEGDSSTNCLSPVKMNESRILPSSPLQSGMFAHGPPLKRSSNINYNHDTSAIDTSNLSSSNISPIQNTMNMSCESVRSRPRSVARLNFTTEMTVNQSSNKYEELNDCPSDVSLEKVDVRATEKKLDDDLNAKDVSTRAKVEKMNVLANDLAPVERNFEISPSEFNSLKHNANALKPVTITCESYVLQQTNGTLGIPDQQSISNYAQDTGYQTYSMSNVTDGYSSPTKQKPFWGERILITDDEFRLSEWKENMKNIFSSTPSRSNRDHLF